MEKAILVHLATNKKEKEEAGDSMEELAGLAAAAGAQVVDKIFQNRPRANPGRFLGEGKVERGPRAEERAGGRPGHLRPQPDPDSAAEPGGRSRSPRSSTGPSSSWTSSRRGPGRTKASSKSNWPSCPTSSPGSPARASPCPASAAGIRTRGPGEKKLEADRRKITDRIARIKKDIGGIQKRRAGQRESRRKSPVPTVSLVGYTSAGKSTLFNSLARERRFTSPNLFATLDPVLRRVSYPDGLHFFLSDTVGFIRKLPVELVTSFQATLEEVRERMPSAISSTRPAPIPGNRRMP